MHRPTGDAGLLHKPSPRDQAGQGQAGGVVADSVPQVKGAETPAAGGPACAPQGQQVENGRGHLARHFAHVIQI